METVAAGEKVKAQTPTADGGERRRNISVSVTSPIPAHEQARLINKSKAKMVETKDVGKEGKVEKAGKKAKSASPQVAGESAAYEPRAAGDEAATEGETFCICRSTSSTSSDGYPLCCFCGAARVHPYFLFRLLLLLSLLDSSFNLLKICPNLHLSRKSIALSLILFTY